MEIVLSNLELIPNASTLKALKLNKKTHRLSLRREDSSWYAYLPGWPFGAGTAEKKGKKNKTSKIVKCVADTFAYGIGFEGDEKKKYLKAFKYVKNNKEELSINLNEKSKELFFNIIKFYNQKNKGTTIEFKNSEELKTVLYGILKAHNQTGKISSKNKAIFLALKEALEPSVPKSINDPLPFLKEIQKGGIKLNHTLGPVSKKWAPAGGISLPVDPRLAKLAKKKLRKIGRESISNRLLHKEIEKTRRSIQEAEQRKGPCRAREKTVKTEPIPTIRYEERPPPKQKSIEEMLAEQRQEEIEEEPLHDDEDWNYEREDIDQILEDEVQIKVTQTTLYDETRVNSVAKQSPPLVIEDDPTLELTLKKALIKNRMVIAPKERKKLKKEFRKLQKELFG